MDFEANLKMVGGLAVEHCVDQRIVGAKKGDGEGQGAIKIFALRPWQPRLASHPERSATKRDTHEQVKSRTHHQCVPNTVGNDARRVNDRRRHRVERNRRIVARETHVTSSKRNAIQQMCESGSNKQHHNAYLKNKHGDFFYGRGGRGGKEEESSSNHLKPRQKMRPKVERFIVWVEGGEQRRSQGVWHWTIASNDEQLFV